MEEKVVLDSLENVESIQDFTPFQVENYEILGKLDGILLESYEKSLLYNLVIYERFFMSEIFHGKTNFLSNETKSKTEHIVVFLFENECKTEQIIFSSFENDIELQNIGNEVQIWLLASNELRYVIFGCMKDTMNECLSKNILPSLNHNYLIGMVHSHFALTQMAHRNVILGYNKVQQ